MTTDLDQLLGAFLVGHQPQLLEPGGYRAQPPLGAIVAERPARPQPECCVVGGDGIDAARHPRDSEPHFEFRSVVRGLVDRQLIAVLASHDAAATERRPQP